MVVTTESICSPDRNLPIKSRLGSWKANQSFAAQDYPILLQILKAAKMDRQPDKSMSTNY